MRKLPFIAAAILIMPFYAVIGAYLWLCHQEDLRGQRRFRSGIIKRPRLVR